MTTILIDKVNNRVMSDSRGTSRNISGIFKKVEKLEVDDTVKKIFKVGKHVICGTGSLFLLEEMVERFECGKIFTPKTFWVKSSYELCETCVYVCKTQSFLKVPKVKKMHVLRLTLKPQKNLFGYIRIKVAKDVIKDSITFDGSGRSYAEGAWNLKGSYDLEDCMRSAMKCDEYSGGELVEVYV